MESIGGVARLVRPASTGRLTVTLMPSPGVLAMLIRP